MNFNDIWISHKEMEGRQIRDEGVQKPALSARCKRILVGVVIGAALLIAGVLAVSLSMFIRKYMYHFTNLLNLSLYPRE